MRKQATTIKIIFSMILSGISSLPVLAQVRSPIGLEAPAHLEIVSGFSSGQEESKEKGQLTGGTYQAAIEIKLQPGWKTYWKYPGDVGIAPKFSWIGSQNLEKIEISFPAPQKWQENDIESDQENKNEPRLVSLGYHQTVMLPLQVTAKQQHAPVVLQGEIEIGVCEKICVPYQARLSHVFSVATEDQNKKRLSQVRQQQYAETLLKIPRTLSQIQEIKPLKPVITRLPAQRVAGERQGRGQGSGQGRGQQFLLTVPPTMTDIAVTEIFLAPTSENAERLSVSQPVEVSKAQTKQFRFEVTPVSGSTLIEAVEIEAVMRLDGKQDTHTMSKYVSLVLPLE